ncbi:unnamed protein product [Toxocara canis]|uniref:Aromatic-L-amino-acid decarboxylase n=1 Tax=Toxocara canis TaxID=6265 RepID=A0A183UVT3_TOXCA|nr:unnamed protein product [Toxocara canis]
MIAILNTHRFFRFREDEPISKLESFLNGVCSTIDSNIGRRRQARAAHDEGIISEEEDSTERRKKNSGTISVKEWVIVAVVIIVCIGFAAIAIMFYLDHKFNLKRIMTLKGKLPMEETKDNATSKTSEQNAKKKSKWKKNAEREANEKGVGKKMGKKKNEKKKKKDEKEVDESLRATMPSGEHYTHIFVKHICDVANFCMEYEDGDAVPKKELKIIIPGTIERNIAEPNETPTPPSAIIDELKGVILPMFEQYPKVRAHSFYPGVQSLTDILVEFGCNLLAARGIVTDGSPGMLELEMVTTSWVGKAFGLPSSFLRGKNSEGGGLLLTTTTEGMFTAMLAAREKKLHEILKANSAERGEEASHANDEDSVLKSMIAYGCNEEHLSFDFGCQLANIEGKLISLDMFDAMNVDELEREIIKDLNNKKIPMFVNTTFGSTYSCSFDKLDLITKVAKKYGIWVHVNASYAGNYLICPSYRSFIEGLENANSICINLHKCLTQSSHTTFF